MAHTSMHTDKLFSSPAIARERCVCVWMRAKWSNLYRSVSNRNKLVHGLMLFENKCWHFFAKLLPPFAAFLPFPVAARQAFSVSLPASVTVSAPPRLAATRHGNIHCAPPIYLLSLSIRYAYTPNSFCSCAPFTDTLSLTPAHTSAPNASFKTKNRMYYN